MDNQEKIIEIIEFELERQGITPSKMCKDLGFPRSVFSRWSKRYIDSRNANQKPASIKAEHLVNILFYLNIIEL